MDTDERKSNMSEKKKIDWKKYLIIFIIASGTTVMYNLPYLKSTFYDPMREALGLSHQELGNLISMYGILATILYFPSGFLADKFSAKKLLSFSLIASGVLGFYFATFPSYGALLFIFAAWGVTTIFTFWAASVKVVRMLGDKDEQGKLFGFNEGLSGIAGIVVSFIGLYLFETFSDVTIGFKYVVWMDSALSILCGVLLFFIIKEKKVEGVDKVGLRETLSAVKLPKAWLIGGIIFSTYMVFSSLTYLNPYLSDIFLVSSAVIGALAIIRTYAIKLGASPLAGIIVDKVGSSIQVMKVGFVGVAACELIFLLLPRQQSLGVVAILMMLVLSIVIFGFRGIYFATVAESNIPVKISGGVIGLASFVGFCPDAFFSTLVGGWLDQSDAGYTYLFALCLACSILGFACCVALHKMNQKEKAAASQAA